MQDQHASSSVLSLPANLDPSVYLTLNEIRAGLITCVDSIEELLTDEQQVATSPGEIEAKLYLEWITEKSIEVIEKLTDFMQNPLLSTNICDYLQSVLFELHVKSEIVEEKLGIEPTDLLEHAQEWDKMPFLDSCVAALGLWAIRIIKIQAKLNDESPEQTLNYLIDEEEFISIANEMEREGFFAVNARRIRERLVQQRNEILARPLAKVVQFVRRIK